MTLLPARERTLPAKDLERVAVLRALNLGDMLCAVPALRALRSALPDAAVTLIGLPWAADFAARFPQYIDRFLSFPGYPGLPEQNPDVQAVALFLHDTQDQSFDLLIQMHGSGGIVNPLALLLGARSTVGFFVPGELCPVADRFLPYPEGLPEPLRLLRLIEFLGGEPRGDHLEFPLGNEDYADLSVALAGHPLHDRGYLCLHPGGRHPARRWSLEGFASVARALTHGGFTVVLTGSDTETEITSKVAALAGVPVIDLAGRTSLGALAALVARTRLLVCNDTGVSHLAAALRTPSLVLMRNSDPLRWSPLDAERHHVLVDSAETPLTVDRVIEETLPLALREPVSAVS